MNRQMFFSIYNKLQSIIAPKLRYSQSIYEDVLLEHSGTTSKWLDLGCGHRLLPSWRIDQEKILVSKVKLIVGIDYDHFSLTRHHTINNLLRGDISALPFRDNSFDLITSNMVFEHLLNPEDQLKEISRVLSKGGKLIFHTPNSSCFLVLLASVIPEFIKDKLVYILERRKEEDVFPAYYKLNTPSIIRELAKTSGLNVLKINLICTSALFIIFPPLVLIELIWIRFLLSNKGKSLRPNIIAILEKR